VTDVAIGGLESAAPPKGDSGRGARFPLFDGFRAIAAISVLLTHVSYITGSNAKSKAFGPYLARMDAGVAVFFIISGFLLYRPFVSAHLTGRDAPATAPYLRRRALRIFPGYWLALTVAVYAFKMGTVPDVRSFLVFYSLTHIYSTHYVLGPLVQAWTLATEIAFYLFLPLWAALLRRAGGTPQQRYRAQLIGCAVLYAAGVAFRIAVFSSHLDDPHTGMMLTWLPAWLDFFALGMLLATVRAWLTQTGTRAPLGLEGRALPLVSWILAGVSFWAVSTRLDLPLQLIHYTSSQQMGKQFLYASTAFFLLLPGIFGPQDRGVIRRFLRSRPMQLLGLISYGIYLWHDMWIDRVIAWRHLHAFTAPFGGLLRDVLVLTLVAATVSYVVVEKPALRLKESRQRRATTASQ
jgi:peptidoglycan/LPS O-acetylase OafA/YrhL